MAAEGGDGRPPVTEAAKTAVAPSPRSPPKYPDFCGRRRLQLEVQILNREVGFIEEELQSLEGLQPVSRCCKEVNEFVGANPDPLIPLNKKRRRSCRIWRWLGSKLCFSFSWICCCTGCCHQLKRLRCSCPGCTCCPHRCTCPGWTCCTCCPHRCTCCPHPKNPCCCRCCCEVSCCRPPRCCYCPELSCCRLLPRCCSWNLSCCRLPRCCRSLELSCCRPPQCCFREVSCSKLPRCCFVPSFSCPEYSCGCVWDCPRCTGVQLCPKCSRPCCITGCLC